MRILVDIMHPAHVHFFRNAVSAWKKKGHEVLVTSRKKEITLELLDKYGIDNICLSVQQSGLAGLFRELIIRDSALYMAAREFRPDVLTGIAGVSIAHVGALIGRPSVVFYDTETAVLSNAITYPLASVVCTPDCYMGDIGKKHVRYAGYHELAYLHPAWFTPDRRALSEAGIEDGRFFILRFVSWKASHDLKQKGVPPEAKRELVNTLKGHGRVFISSEGDLPREFEQYKMPVSWDRMHDLMAFADMVIGEGATVASEAAMLGTPALYISKPGKGLGYTNELEKKYGLIYNFSAEECGHALEKVRGLLSRPGLKKEWEDKRDKMLKEKIDVTNFIAGFVETYPSNPAAARRLAAA
ncbi:MAG: DUF354 domain-containing protein [Candidatus Omnitrophota bacterium]